MALGSSVISINDDEFRVVVEFKNKKNSSARLSGDTIFIRLTSNASQKVQDEHYLFLLESIKGKILKKRVRPMPFVIDITRKFVVADRSILVDVIFEKRKTSKAVIASENSVILRIPDNLHPRDLQDTIRKLVSKSLCIMFEDQIRQRVLEINANTFKHHISKVKLKEFSSKWGDCSSENVIRLNPILLFCPEEVLNYLIIHELSHIGAFNHSKNYWDKVDKFCPDRKKQELWLKKNGQNYLNFKVVYDG